MKNNQQMTQTSSNFQISNFSIQNRHWNVRKQFRHENTATNQQENAQSCHPLLAHTQELRFLTWCTRFGFLLQTVHVRNREHGRGHKPRQPPARANNNHNRNHEQVQVVADALFELVLATVYDDGRDLLVQEYQDHS